MTAYYLSLQVAVTLFVINNFGHHNESESLKINSLSATQKIRRLLWFPKINFCGHKSSPLARSDTNLFHNLIS
jgi:hypothetical protein